MKTSESILKLIAIISILAILAIAGSFFIHGFFFPSKTISKDPKVIDIHFEVQEWNISYLHNKTIIHVTYDELKDFPDFEKSMHGVTNGPGTWSYGHRVISWFDGNESEYIWFHQAVCKNLTLVECYPNPGVYEYHGQYYMIFSDRIGSHTLAGCERGNYYCTNLTR